MSATPPAVPRIQVFKPNKERLEALLETGQYSRYLASALLSRGIDTPEKAARFISPSLNDLHDPRLLPDYTAARDIIFGAIERKEPIFLNGDYDVDGFTSTALLTRSLSKLGATISPFVPQREDGFGISKDAVMEARKQGAKILLSCDCGSSSIEAVGAAKEAGMKVVITDHHLPETTLPQADAIVNPNLSTASYPWKGLSGAGVAFKLVMGFAEERGFKDQFISKYLDLAVIGTIADHMPLFDENRILAVHGIPAVLNSQKPGIRAMLDLIKERKRLPSLGSRRGWGSLVSFDIAPRLNSGSRMSDASIPLRLMLTCDRSEADEISQQLNSLNNDRKVEQARIYSEILSRIQEPPLFIVEGDRTWNPGIVGIAAANAAEQFNRPALIFGYDQNSGQMKGSMRTIGIIHAKEVIDRFPDLIQGGGHAAAAGAALIHGSIEELRAAINEYAAQHIRPEDLVPVAKADFVVDLADFTIMTVMELELLEPFGGGSSKPVGCLKDLKVKRVITMGAEGQHVRIIAADSSGQTAEIIFWGKAKEYGSLKAGAKIDVAAEPSINEFNGSQSLQWMGICLKQAQPQSL